MSISPSDNIAARVQQTREIVRQNFDEVKSALAVPARTVDSIRKQPWTWVGGAFLVAGVLAMVCVPRKGRSKASVPTFPKCEDCVPEATRSNRMGATAAKFAWDAARTVFPIVRPFVAAYVTRMAAAYAQRMVRK